jgi:hypothetical protein
MVYVKYLILAFAFIAGADVIAEKSIAIAILAAGAFIAYAIIEVQDVKILNNPARTEE